MKIETLELVKDHFQLMQTSTFQDFNAQLVFMFGDENLFKNPKYYLELKKRYPNANILGCSSSGNVLGVEISHAPIVATAVQFTTSHVRLHKLALKPILDEDKFKAQLSQTMDDLNSNGLKHLFVLASGLNMNSSQLVSILNKVSPVPVTGGIAGGEDFFMETWIVADDKPQNNVIALLGFYGDSIHTGYGCYAGWSEFGAERHITKSTDNIVYEIDSQPALDLYKKYLGDYAHNLPNSGLRFPLSIKQHDDDPEVIRSMIAISEEDKSITFAGNVPTGFKARLMKPNLDSLIDGAGMAAQQIRKSNDLPALGLVVSCEGRKVVMGEMIEEELDAIEDVLGKNVLLCGFYSHGEISPMNDKANKSSLHNQTMTLTTIYEDE
ncbi:FIST N-terminal domain-containing protein [Thiomicrorhabdus hydrogeniphila]